MLRVPTAVVCALTFASSARADVPASPNLFLDSEALGFPIGVIVGLALAAAAVSGVFVLRRRGVRALPAIILCLVIAGAMYLATYAVCEKMGVPVPPSPPRD